MKKLMFILILLLPVSKAVHAEEFGADIPISRAMVAKMLALSCCSMAEINSFPHVISFNDVQKDDWFDKYINAAVNKKLMSGMGDEFMPNQSLTVSQAQILLEKYAVKIKSTDDDKNKPIAYSLWLKLFSKTNLKQKDIIVLATHDDNKKIPLPFLITDSEIYSFDGRDETLKLTDKSVSVLIKDNEILGITAISDEYVLKSCRVLKLQPLKVYINGVKRVFKSNLTLDEDKAYDLKFSNGKLIDAVLSD